MRFCFRLLRLALAVCGISVSGLGAVAQSIGVQSGEHEGFTRLVLDIGADRDWTLSGAGDRRHLALTPPVDDFAIGRVFDLIPRSRLAALAIDNGLVLTLACACDVSASRYQDRYLILDIVPSPIPQPGVPPPDDTAAIRRQTAAERLPNTARMLTAGTASAALPVPSMPQSSVGPVDLEEAARIMSEQLARAAASGLLSAAPLRPMSDADPVPDPGIGRPEDMTPDRALSFDPASASPPIRAETALDAATRHSLAPEPQRHQLICQRVEMSMRDWSRGAGVDDGLGVLRAALYDDRDQLQREAVLALARHYLVYGFGAEAAYWLGQIDDAPDDLVVIADLVDGEEGQQFPAEPDPLLCSDEELLWRYLDGALDAQSVTEEQAGRLQRATAALPSSLRDQIAPRIARRLQADGHPQYARNLRDMLLRGGRLSDAVVLALDLDLGILRPGDAASGAAIAGAIRDDGADPVPMMAHALALDREIGVPASDIRLGAAEALLREHGLGADTAVLWQEVTLAHAVAGRLDHVLVLLAGADALPSPTRDDALTALFADRLAAGDTPALFLLARIHGATWQAVGSVAGRTRVGVIARLRASGLVEAAEILRIGQPALILPVRPRPPSDPQTALRAAWHSGDWATLATGATGPHQAIAQRMAAPLPAPPDPTTFFELSTLVAQLADSSGLREDIAALLLAPVPVAGEMPGG